VRWQRQLDVERYQHGIQHMDPVRHECRERARWGATTQQYDAPVPEELSAAIERLAEVIRLLGQEHQSQVRKAVGR
jgi:hypothetical protein